MGAVDGLVNLIFGVEIGPDDGCPRRTSRVAKARAGLESMRDLIAGQHGKHVRLIVVEEAPVRVRAIFSLAANQRIREPAEETLGQLLAQKHLSAIATPDSAL